MTAPLSAERAKELREQIRTGAVVIWSPDISGVADIINIVERYSAMRAENASDKRGPAKCPVCEGTGWLPTAPPPGATNPTSVPCHSCKGAGWILPYGPFCFGETTPAPSPGPSSSIEGYPASVKQALTVPAPLPAEAEEAMDIMGEFDNLVSSCHGGYIETDPEFKPCFEGCIPGIDAIRNALKAQLASNRLTVQYANAPTIKKDLTVAPLPAEVEEAMDTLRVFGMSGASETGDIPASEREILAALAVIRAALALREEKK